MESPLIQMQRLLNKICTEIQLREGIQKGNQNKFDPGQMWRGSI